MSVGRICIREVDTIEPTESVLVAAERMHQRAVGTLVVVDSEAAIVGIVTDRDLVERVLAKALDAGTTTVDDVMTRRPHTIAEDAPIESALAAMRDGRFRRMPVVDDDERLVGLVSLDDVVALLAEEAEMVGQLLKRQTPAAVAARA